MCEAGAQLGQLRLSSNASGCLCRIACILSCYPLGPSPVPVVLPLLVHVQHGEVVRLGDEKLLTCRITLLRTVVGPVVREKVRGVRKV